jgi:predicted unusual protein kinase regulating ubiquinone biosynthesis (AarF/ABC1/UbiB family)/class 3 adenylate cyclase
VDPWGDGGGGLTATGPFCGSCGAQSRPAAKFCSECGTRLTRATHTAEYKQVTVLFADVVRSMDIAAAVDVERLREIITELVERSAAVVQRYGGTVEYTGDGVMAIFGAPAALEDHAFRACLAALDIQEEANRLAVEVQRRDGVALRLRVGLNSGQVIAGEIGSGSFGYTAVGEQVGMAQRMESVAPPGGVMVSESTARLVNHVAVLSEMEMVSIKGANAPVPARRLVAMEQHRGSLGRSEATLVGRHQQITVLNELLDRSMSGHGAVVGVVGAAGIGKSRVVREAAAIAAARGIDVFWTFCESLASEIPLHVVSHLLRAATRIGEMDGAAARVQVRARFRAADAEDLLLLDDLLGIAEPGVAPPQIDPDARRRRLTALVNAASLARGTPAVFVIEDVQWIDEVSESMLADFLTVIPQTPVMVLITYRPDYPGGLTRAADAHTISLAPLSDSETTALITELLGVDSSVGDLTMTIADRASGNPFFAAEIVRDLAERRVLVGDRGAYVCIRDVAEVTVPATLQAAIAARIDRLEPTAKRSLGAAAVIGSRFDTDLLKALDVEPALDLPVKAELIYKVGGGPRAEYVFHHPLIRAVAYESQLKSDRAELHRRLASVIQVRDPTSVDENAALIAEHVQATGDVPGAYGWHMRAASWLAQRDLVGACQSWERARDCAEALPMDYAHRTAMGIAPRVMLCVNGIRVNATTTDVRFAELQQLCQEADDKASLAFGMAGMLPVHVLHGRVREASQLASEYMTLVESIGDPTLTVLLAFVALPIKMETGPIADALRWAQVCIDLSEDNPLLEPMVAGAFAVRGSARWAQGNPGWRDDLEKAVAMARGTDPMVRGYVVSVTYSAIAAGVMLADDEALANVDEALRVSERSSDDLALGLARLSMGFALLYRDSAAERERGAGVLAQVREMILAKRFYASELPIVEAWIAREMFVTGDRDGALPMIRKAVETLFDTGQWGYLSATAGVLVDTLLARGKKGDIGEADRVIQRLAIGPGEAPLYREVWLLRLRALVARARGEEIRYRELAQRYRVLATSLGFEGHMAMAEAMTATAREKTSGGIVPSSATSAVPVTGDGIPRGRIRRTIPLAGLAARAAGDRIVAGLREKTGDTGAVARFHERNAERYSELLGHSKGVLMKVGQILSMFDTNVLGSGFMPYHATLARLQADAPPMDPDLAKQTLHADLGRSTDTVFAWFSDEPMAAASIGQVHRAVMHDGREVAVKIQYPGAAEAIRADLANHEMVTKFLGFVSSASGATMPDLRPATREIVARIAEEIDYRHEAANITAFSELYRGHPFILIPDVVAEASGDRVLTMTYLDGLDWAAAQGADQDLKNTWAEVISRFLGGSIRHANLFHADPHPGNYRFGPDGRVGFLDFGCVKVLSERQRRGLVGMARATVDGRKNELRDLMVESGFLASDSAMTVDQAYEWWAGTLHEMLAPQPFAYTRDDPIRAIRGFIDLRAADHPARQMLLPEESAFFPRLYVGMYTLFATLQATLPARSIYDDLDGIAEPGTPLGEQHHAWVRRRGLPCGLEAHDHP